MSKNPLIIVPIEPLEERYSASWYRNFPELFRAYECSVRVVDGKALEDTVKVGTFLDINSTVHYKMTQLQEIARMFHAGEVEQDTVFFFGDVEFWGLESVRLLAQMNGVRIKMCGFLHAGSYTKEDAFAIAAPYQKYTEVGWAAALDKVFVGSEYHQETFFKRRLAPLGEQAKQLVTKLIVTKNPLFMNDYPVRRPFAQKQKKVLLTNRFDSEKRPGETLSLFQALKAEFPDWEFVITTGRSALERSNAPDLVRRARALEQAGVVTIKDGLTKDQYHNELSEAAVMVSHSIEENYGYCIAEALLYGVVPLLRRGLSHDEFVEDDLRLLFDTEQSPDNDLMKARNLLRSFGTESWPHPPKLDTSGARSIVLNVLQLFPA